MRLVDDVDERAHSTHVGVAAAPYRARDDDDKQDEQRRFRRYSYHVNGVVGFLPTRIGARRSFGCARNRNRIAIETKTQNDSNTENVSLVAE
jgi:hypothetical protein